MPLRNDALQRTPAIEELRGGDRFALNEAAARLRPEMTLVPPLMLAPGGRLGRYELVQFLGEGGFAEVWLAKLRGLAGFEKRVAIKVLRRHRARDVKLQTMLLDEALIASKIDHPNVATAHELGEDQGIIYLVMEYLGGGSVDALVDAARERGEAIPLPIATRILVEACSGLHAAHELTVEGRPLGLVHRDVSPQNIILTEGGVAKIIDFGIAKARERLAPETTSGTGKGNLSYMSPEHARGEVLDRRADLWSLASVAFVMFEGEPVIPGPNPSVRASALVSGVVAPSFRRTPPPIASVLERALAPRPEDRYASADDMRVALEDMLADAGLVLASHGEVRAFRERVSVARKEAPHSGVQDVRTVTTFAPSSARATPPARSRRGRLLGFGLGVAAVAAVTAAVLAQRSPSAKRGEVPSPSALVSVLPVAANAAFAPASSSPPDASFQAVVKSTTVATVPLPRARSARSATPLPTAPSNVAPRAAPPSSASPKVYDERIE